jgi:hypothetical protein
MAAKEKLASGVLPGGAVAGETALYAVPTMGAAGLVAAGAAGSVVTDTLKSVGSSEPVDGAEVALNATIVGVAALVPGAKSAAGSVSKQILTKFEKGQLKSMAAKTAAKVTAGKVLTDGGGGVAGGMAAAEKDKIKERQKAQPQSVSPPHAGCVSGQPCPP